MLEMTSGVSATNSIADLRMRSTSPPQRMSIRRFRPTLYPAPSSPCMNAAAEFGHRVVRGQGHQYADAPHPLRLLRACGQTTTEPAIPLMKSRRRIAFPRLRTAPTSVKAANYSRDLRSAKWGSMIICTANNLEPHEMGQKRTSRHVRFMLYLRKQTSIRATDMSALCQQRTSAACSTPMMDHGLASRATETGSQHGNGGRMQAVC
jgi:hypothetical protein